MNVVPGTTAVITLGSLRPAHPESRVELVSATVGGTGMNSTVGRLEGVQVYRINAQGGIGAITADQLSGVDGGPGWTLLDPEGAVVTEHNPRWDAVLLVSGLEDGVWSADYVDYVYRIDGRRGTQRVPNRSHHLRRPARSTTVRDLTDLIRSCREDGVRQRRCATGRNVRSCG